MSMHERTDRMLDRAARGEANIGEIEECISATRADLDRNLSAIEQRLSSDELINQAVDYLRAGPNEFLSNFGRAVKANPVPAALMTVSIAWLMFGGRSTNGTGTEAYRADWAEGDEVTRSDPSYSGENVGNGRDGSGPARRAVETVRERAARLGDRASQVADRASQWTDRASSVGDQVGRKFNEVGGKMTEASKHAQEVFRTARERIAQARATLAQQPKRLQTGYQDLTESHPFVLGALAFVAGAAIAASLRRTQIEDQMLGEYRDGALEQAERRARSELNHGIETAKSALTAAGGESSDNQMEMEMDESRDGGEGGDESSFRDSSPVQRENQDRFH